LNMPIVIGGDFNVYENPFEHLENLSGIQPTFHNDETSKLDFVVGKNVNMISNFVKDISKSETRWPNEQEGSDHTAVYVEFTI
jgi:endonuclease/exonuclease/phosphatase (EEP) superfamily protein YafD